MEDIVEKMMALEICVIAQRLFVNGSWALQWCLVDDR